jgi:4a-hydroxytetrahydrobiopterin dehydratase
MSMGILKDKRCLPCEGGVKPLDKKAVEKLLDQLHTDWHVNETHTEISRRFSFKGYYKTMAFVNAVAWIANQENHHPDLLVAYNYCEVRYTTHAINGLSENDFICAAKVDALMDADDKPTKACSL